MSHTSLSRLDLSAPEGLTAKFESGNLVVVASFGGVVPRGSAGGGHANYIRVWTEAAVQLSDARGLVLDFRELEYTMGNSMLGVFHAIAELQDRGHLMDLPRAFTMVTSERCHHSMVSLVTPDRMPVPGWIFSDFDEALAATTKAVAIGLNDEDDGESREDLERVRRLKMYILVRDDVTPGFAILAAAHGALAGYLQFKDRDETRYWISGPFRKVVCSVSADEFEQARQVPDGVVITESALEGREVAIAFRPREQWPPEFRALRLYGRN